MQFILTQTQKNIDRHYKQVLVYFGITIEKITSILTKHLQILNTVTIRYEVAAFIYFRLYNYSSILSYNCKWFMTSLRDHIDTIIKCDSEYLDARLILYHQLWKEYCAAFPSKDRDKLYEEKLYSSFSKLINKAIFYSGETFILNGHEYLVTIHSFPGLINDLDIYDKINIPVEEIKNEILNFFDKCDNPLKLQLH